jgi:hypothetical protein
MSEEQIQDLFNISWWTKQKTYVVVHKVYEFNPKPLNEKNLTMKEQEMQYKATQTTTRRLNI